MKYSYCLATWEVGWHFMLVLEDFIISVFSRLQLGRNAWEALAHPSMRGVTFAGHGQEFNQYYTPHKPKCRYAVTGISTYSATLNCNHGLQPCVLEWLQSTSENQLLIKSIETALLKNHLPVACNAFAFFFIQVWVFFLVGYKQNKNHHPN